MNEINWWEFGDPHQDTGYPSEVLDYVWNKYGGKGLLTDAEDMYR